jgi:hypothetical protein
METQEPWDREQIVLINMHWDHIEVAEDKNNPVLKEKEGVFDIGNVLPREDAPVSAQQFVDEIKETPVTPPSPPQPVEEKKDTPVVNTVPEQIPEWERVKKAAVVFYCVPVARGRNGERLFGDQFTFEGVIAAQEDLTLHFWTSMTLRDGFIVYPQAGDKRWWIITGSESKAGGRFYRCAPSSLNPDFSRSGQPR